MYQQVKGKNFLASFKKLGLDDSLKILHLLKLII